jgi:hypothetical protein
MMMVQPDEFEEFYKKGKTIEEYIETIENKEIAKNLKFYYKRAKVPEYYKQRLSETLEKNDSLNDEERLHFKILKNQAS